MSRDMVNHTKVNAICDWEFSKNRLMKLAVRMAISGNMLMMLARSRSDENNERKCVTGERCVFDYEEGNWFTHVDEFSGTCKVCGNDKQFNDFIQKINDGENEKRECGWREEKCGEKIM